MNKEMLLREMKVKEIKRRKVLSNVDKRELYIKIKVLVLEMKVKEIEDIESKNGKCNFVRVSLCTRTPRGKSSD